MPRITSDSLDQHKLPTGSYGYSAAKMDDLGATEYTLVTIVVDISGSVHPYRDEMEQSIKEVVNACKFSPRADNLMIRLSLFNTQLDELHGFKLLEQCNPDDYDGSLHPGGGTALYDAAENGISATTDYAKQLIDNDFSVNSILFVITDGDDNSSTLGIGDVKKALSKALKTEMLESVVTVLIGVGVKQEPQLAAILDEFHKQAGITQFIALDDADAKTLAKLADFISKSISAQSQALGTGGPSSQISLTI